MEKEHVIEFRNVHKAFENFCLTNFSMNIKKGYVTGFIGGNGVGKSTIIKLMMNLLQPDSGEISIFGLGYKEHEKEIKQRIGFVLDDNIFYEELTLTEMKNFVKKAYVHWDEHVFQEYVQEFNLPLKQKIKTFSKGMKMKASLTIALSHHAELIIMDEPTSGLDPIFRRELMEMLHNLIQDGNKTIFFSTHNTTDLMNIADYITFIHNGEHIFTKNFYEIEEQYAVVKGGLELLDRDTEQEFIAIQKSPFGFEALTCNRKRVQDIFEDMVLIEKPTLEDIMYFTKKGLIRHAELNR